MKKRIHIEAKLPLSIFKEGDQFIAYTPALKLSTSGKDFNEVNKRFLEAVNIFIEESLKRGTLEQTLEDCGWTKIKRKWSPPTIIKHTNVPIKV